MATLVIGDISLDGWVQDTDKRGKVFFRHPKYGTLYCNTNNFQHELGGHVVGRIRRQKFGDTVPEVQTVEEHTPEQVAIEPEKPIGSVLGTWFDGWMK